MRIVFQTLTRLVPAVLLAVQLAGCNTASSSGSTAETTPGMRHEDGRILLEPSSPIRKALVVAAVEARAVERQVVTPGVVEADAARLVKVVPPVSGRIVRLVKHLGDPVNRGDPLFVLDSPELAQALADAAKADAALTLSRRALDRQRELMAAEIAARKDVEQAENDFAQAESDAHLAHGRLAQLDVAAGDASGRQYTLRAPIPGHVIDLTAAEGGFWNDTSAPIMTVADLSTVWIAASVPEKDLSAISVGQDATIELNAYAGESEHGKIAYIGEVLDPDTRTVKARIAVDNPSGRFRPGMFARVVFHAPAHEGMVVPATALIQSGFDTQVYVETQADVFEARTVEVGPRLADSVEVLSGLNGADRVVVKNGVLLND